MLESIYCYDFARFFSRVHLRAFFLSVISWSLKPASGLLKYLGLLQQCCFEAEKLQEFFLKEIGLNYQLLQSDLLIPQMEVT